MMDRVGAAIRKARAQQAAEAERQDLPRVLPGGSAWADLNPFDPDPDTMARNRVVTFGRHDAACDSFAMLRTRLLRLMRQNGWTSVGITSPTSGCGKTTTSLNLAFSFAQLELRTMLVDLDLRRPAVARHIGLARPLSMAEVLQGTRQAGDAFVRCADNLAIGGGTVAIRNSADVLMSAATAQGLDGIRRRFEPDILIYDLPPMLVSDDVLAFTPHLDCVLLVVGAEVSRLDEVSKCRGELEAHVGAVLIVVNKCRYPDGAVEYA